MRRQVLAGTGCSIPPMLVEQRDLAVSSA